MGRTQKSRLESLLGPLGDKALRLTKEQVAERELNAAIRLFFSEGDPVAVHVLARAACDVLTPIGRTRGLPTSDTSVANVVKDEYVEAFKELMKAPYNFMKHGARDADATIESFNPSVNDMHIFFGVADFGIIFNRYSREMVLFLSWIREARPKCINEGALGGTVDEVRTMLKEAAGDNMKAAIRATLDVFTSSA